jgi:hypothetical protein
VVECVLQPQIGQPQAECHLWQLARLQHPPDLLLLLLLTLLVWAEQLQTSQPQAECCNLWWGILPLRALYLLPLLLLLLALLLQWMVQLLGCLVQPQTSPKQARHLAALLLLLLLPRSVLAACLQPLLLLPLLAHNHFG